MGPVKSKKPGVGPISLVRQGLAALLCLAAIRFGPRRALGIHIQKRSAIDIKFKTWRRIFPEFRLTAKPIFLILFLSAVTTASAATITIAESGTWNNDCPAVYCTGVGATWSFYFEVASPPVLIGSYSGFFLAAISDFTFSDNGVVQAALTGSETQVYFFSAAEGGGFATFDDVFDVSTLGQLYTGLVTAPTFVPGLYTVVGYPTIGLQTEYTNGGVTVSGGSDTSGVAPEPATSGLILTGLGLLVCLRKRILPPFRPNTRTNP
jgi:hypothetical protein